MTNIVRSCLNKISSICPSRITADATKKTKEERKCTSTISSAAVVKKTSEPGFIKRLMTWLSNLCSKKPEIEILKEMYEIRKNIITEPKGAVKYRKLLNKLEKGTFKELTRLTVKAIGYFRYTKIRPSDKPTEQLAANLLKACTDMKTLEEIKSRVDDSDELDAFRYIMMPIAVEGDVAFAAYLQQKQKSN